MADSDPMEPPDIGQILHADLSNHVKRRVNREIDEMIDCAGELRGLGALLDWYSALETRASPETMREAAVGVRAVAMQAFIGACRAAGISARLHAWADIVGIVDPPQDGGTPAHGTEPEPGGQGVPSNPE